MPKNTLRLSPRSIAEAASCFVAWSSTMKSPATIAAPAAGDRAARRLFRPRAAPVDGPAPHRGPAPRLARRQGLAPDEVDDDAADDRQHQHAHDRAQVERARSEPDRRDDPPEEVQ